MSETEFLSGAPLELLHTELPVVLLAGGGNE